jgi:hypothetical protein
MKTRTALFSLLLFGAASVSPGIDDAGLRDWLLSDALGGYDGIPFELIDRFREKSGVADEQFHRVLMEIYREAEDKRSSLTPKTREWFDNQTVMGSVINLLSKCGDVPVKDFLLDCASSKEKDPLLRSEAVLSYLPLSNAEETKDILLRFLVGEDRMDLDRSSVCRYARTAFMNTADAGKRAAILESLYASLSREDTKWLFRSYDNVLCELSGDYADSRQRLAILQRLIDAPPLCKADDSLMPWLTGKLKELQKTRPRTDINTNLAAVVARDFNLPSPESLAGGGPEPALGDADPGAAATGESPPPRPFRPAVPLAAVAGLFAAFVLWLKFRKRT